MNYFFLSQGKKHSHSLALWADLCQWHKGIAKSIFNAVSGKNKLKFAADNIALLLMSYFIIVIVSVSKILLQFPALSFNRIVKVVVSLSFESSKTIVFYGSILPISKRTNDELFIQFCYWYSNWWITTISNSVLKSVDLMNPWKFSTHHFRSHVVLSLILYFYILGERIFERSNEIRRCSSCWGCTGWQ